MRASPPRRGGDLFLCTPPRQGGRGSFPRRSCRLRGPLLATLTRGLFSPPSGEGPHPPGRAKSAACPPRQAGRGSVSPTPGSRAVFWIATGGAVCVGPSLRFGGFVLVLLRTACLPLPACAGGRRSGRNAAAGPAVLAGSVCPGRPPPPSGASSGTQHLTATPLLGPRRSRPGGSLLPRRSASPGTQGPARP